MSAKHREAFAHLVYGISEGSGFVAITGEVGAGKTTLIRALLAEAAKDVTVVSIVNPVLTSTELLQTINAELGLPSRSTSRKELLEELSAFLQRNKKEGRRTVIIVDEAQNLDPVVLEQLRLLSNLETETEKLIQVVLVGQPELHGLLQRHDLRQLNQRVTERWHLDKLDRDEAYEYVRHRLRVAGAQGELIDGKGLELMYRFTGGVPRLLNILGHRSLLVAYTRSRGRAGAPEVTAAARELGYVPQAVAREGRSWPRWAAVAGAGVAAAVVAFFLFAPLADDATATRRVGEEAAQAPVQRRSALAPMPATSGEAAVTDVDAAAGAAGASQPSSAEPQALATASASAAPAAAPPRSPPSAESVLAALTSVPVFDAAVTAYSSLLQLWGKPAVTEADLTDSTLDLEPIAASRGLRYLSVEINRALLSVLDLPALIELQLPGQSEVRYALLEGVDPIGGMVHLGGGVAVSDATLDQWWNGRAHILWRDEQGLRFDLGPGSGGPAVRKLQEMLLQAGVYQGEPTGLYDDLTENAVRRFQDARHIATDGVAGPITQILLYNSLGTQPRPTLVRARA
ncbi:MAG TPA: AAA family ATPase [Candidatus Limnocylindrales bacterium]|nr:AAA family ATPase [Candidatus Limnocylindrales bacterium]